MPFVFASDQPTQHTVRTVGIRDLPRRREGEGHPEVFRRLNAPVGGSCVRDCDCADGLVCRAGTCAADW